MEKQQQLESYKKSLETYNDKCENDADFRKLVEDNPEKALNDVGITDVKAFLEFSRTMNASLSDEDMNAVSGGTSQNTFASAIPVAYGVGMGPYALASMAAVAVSHRVPDSGPDWVTYADLGPTFGF